MSDTTRVAHWNGREMIIVNGPVKYDWLHNLRAEKAREVEYIETNLRDKRYQYPDAVAAGLVGKKRILAEMDELLALVGGAS